MFLTAPLRGLYRLLPRRNLHSPPGHYQQGQSPEARVREYFYYIDHQGQLFLDDTKVKNFITCYKERQFLGFFFKQLRRNETGRYQDDFPYVSPCGRERNFIRCDDRPIVFTHLLTDGTSGAQLLSYCGGGDKLTVPFEPENLVMLPDNGRLYHPAPERCGAVGLVKSSLAFELSPFFVYPPNSLGDPPTHFHWNGTRIPLTQQLLTLL
ncbi:UPF0598 protein C8orf82 homolog [Xenopus laevis]|uniref:Uncharacterized protein n=2 Tax=Xenopus laevis TaxID=8355 RepID=A0A974CKK5_XENLA|nr:UPF0598 protein C8orf82 homolog [Xenopus laevis]OCT75128.1 hypothetical protein XELAEV_18034118mg [Xenopus laevis]